MQASLAVELSEVKVIDCADRNGRTVVHAAIRCVLLMKPRVLVFIINSVQFFHPSVDFYNNRNRIKLLIAITKTF